jgi:hypothetical protein
MKYESGISTGKCRMLVDLFRFALPLIESKNRANTEILTSVSLTLRIEEILLV